MGGLDICSSCPNFIAIGEGDAICIKQDEPILVMEDYQSTENTGWCRFIDKE